MDSPVSKLKIGHLMEVFVMANCTENAAPLKNWDKPVKRDANGRFERGSKPLPHAHRPKGSLNKTTTQLREAILGALEAAGGPEGSVGYLRRLAIENSSAFASLLGKVLPTTLAADESGDGMGVRMVFERHIIWPDGHKEIEGATPKQLPAPDAAHALPRPTDPTLVTGADRGRDGGIG